MPKAIEKITFPIFPTGGTVKVEIGRRILRLAILDSGSITLWYETNGSKRTVVLAVYATMENIPDDAQYVGTVLSRENFAYHVYERLVHD